MRYIFSILISVLVSAQSFAQDSTILITNCVDSEICDFPEIDPMFPGGMDSMMTFIAKNFVIPGTCICYSAVIYVGFIVNTDGSLAIVEIIKGSETDLDDEAVRVVKLMPNWIPAQNNGQIVQTKYIIPFQINTI